jgi:hypothetical protein
MLAVDPFSYDPVMVGESDPALSWTPPGQKPEPAESRVSTAKVVAVGTLIWIGAATVVGLLITALDYPNQRTYRALDERGVHATATVTRTEPNNHNTVYYSFVVAGRNYADSGAAHGPNPEAADLRIGDRIQIVYDRTDPRVSCACDPREQRYPARFVPTAIASLFVSSLVALILTAAWVHRRARTTVDANH